MREQTCIRSLTLILLLSYAGFGQSANVYGFFAPGQFRVEGDSATALHFGGGGKYIGGSGLGFGAEAGIAGPKDGFGETYFGLVSPNGYFVFNPNRGAKLQPFVTGGYTRTFGRDFSGNFGNFGAGLTYWAAERAGILVEYRHYIGREEGVTLQLWTVRFGFAFR